MDQLPNAKSHGQPRRYTRRPSSKERSWIKGNKTSSARSSPKGHHPRGHMPPYPHRTRAGSPQPNRGQTSQQTADVPSSRRDSTTSLGASLSSQQVTPTVDYDHDHARHIYEILKVSSDDRTPGFRSPRRSTQSLPRAPGTRSASVNQRMHKELRQQAVARMKENSAKNKYFVVTPVGIIGSLVLFVGMSLGVASLTLRIAVPDSQYGVFFLAACGGVILIGIIVLACGYQQYRNAKMKKWDKH